MESEWAELVEQATAWQHQLEEAEAGLTRLEHELNTIDSKLEGLEAESTAWCLPPSLDSAKAELEELETAMRGLRELQGQVIFLKVIKSHLPPGGHNASNLKQIAAGPGERLQGVRGGEKALCASRCRGCKEISAGGAAGEEECGDHSRLTSPCFSFHRCRRSLGANSSYREASPKVGNVASPTTPFPTLCLTEAAPPSGTILPLSPSSPSLLL